MESLCRRINEGAVTVSHGQVQGGFERLRVALKDFVTDENLMCQRIFSPHDIHRKDLRIAPLRQHKQQGTLGSAFLCPFVVDPNASQDCFPGVLGVAYFNMAVAMHIIATQAPARQASHFMKQARTLYLKGHEYLEEDPSMIQLDGTLVYAYIAICVSYLWVLPFVPLSCGCKSYLTWPSASLCKI